MTQEEKARAYDEALERARALRQEAIDKGYAIDYVKDYEAIFPELAESEDERIRKELKEAFEAYDIESTWNGIPIRSIFAWLEKQKEQQPAEWSEDLKNELAKKHLDGYIMGREDIMREMRDFLESHFNTQSGTSRRQRNEQH